MPEWTCTREDGSEFTVVADNVMAATTAGLAEHPDMVKVVMIDPVAEAAATARAEGVAILKDLGLTEEQALAIAGVPQ